MPWTVRIGRLLGMAISVHLGLVIYVVWILARPVFSGAWRQVWYLLGFLGVAFLFVLLHELAHGLAARFYRVQVRGIVLHPFGGLARLSGSLGPDQSVLVSLAGPLSNVAVLLVLLGLELLGAAPQSPGASWWWAVVLRVNFALAAFNLLPVYPLDGGQIVRALALQRQRYDTAVRGTLRISLALAGIMVIYALVSRNIFVLVIGLFALQVNWAEFSSIPVLRVVDRAAGRRGPRGWLARTRAERDRRWLEARESEVDAIMRKTFDEGYESLTARERRLIRRYRAIRERLVDPPTSDRL
jgi:Zn-dependent protease